MAIIVDVHLSCFDNVQNPPNAPAILPLWGQAPFMCFLQCEWSQVLVKEYQIVRGTSEMQGPQGFYNYCITC